MPYTLLSIGPSFAHGRTLVGMKKVVDRALHGADSAFVEERYLSTNHVYAFVGGDVEVDVGAYRLHCCLRLGACLHDCCIAVGENLAVLIFKLFFHREICLYEDVEVFSLRCEVLIFGP